MRRVHSGILLAISAALALGACGLVEIKPAYDASNANANSGQANAPAPITFHNNPQPTTTAPVADEQAVVGSDAAPENVVDEAVNVTDDLTPALEVATIVETSALVATAAPIEVAELSELPEVADPTSAVQELTPAVEAPLLIASDANSTPPTAVDASVFEDVADDVDASLAEVDEADINASVGLNSTAANASAEPLQRKIVAATITPNILVESQIPELAVELEPQAEVPTNEAQASPLPPAAETTQSHTVVEGETLFSIANKYGVSVEQLAQMNAVAAPNYLIYPEMILKIGTESVATDSNLSLDANISYTEHEVVEGETVYSISRLYQMQPEELARLNDIEIPQYLIYPGMLLRVRAVEGARDAAAESDVAAEPGSVAEPANVEVSDSNDSAEPGGDWQWPLAETGQSQEQLTGELSGVLLLAKAGDVVRAAKGGRVVIAGDQIRPIKLVVLLEHDGGYISFYGYLSDLLVGQGEDVVAGQPLGRIDSNGRLYFDVRLGSTSVDINELY